MRRFAILAAALLLTGARAADKGTVVDFDGLKSTTPDTWVKQEAKGLRFAQFKLPRKGDDKDDAEVVVFKGLGGSDRDNIARWKNQFKAPRGKSVEPKESELKVAGSEVKRLEIEGTWTGTPPRPGTKPEAKEGYKGVFYIFQGPDTVYHIRLAGPVKTVEAYKKGYDDWVKGFKK